VAGQLNVTVSLNLDKTSGGLCCGKYMVPNPSSGNGLVDCAWAAQIVSDMAAVTIQIRALTDALRKSDRRRLRTGQFKLIGFAPTELSNACAKPPLPCFSGVGPIASGVTGRIFRHSVGKRNWNLTDLDAGAD
jgi:hypothetical protein